MSQLLHLLDRPIAFQRSFLRLGVGVTGALFLSQMIYWQNRMDGEWFYKTQADLEDETGLGRYAQEAARKKLTEIGVLEEQKKGIPAKLYFRVNEAAILALLMPESQQASMQEDCNQVCGKPASLSAENQQAGMRKTSTPACGKPASIHTVDYTKTTTKNFIGSNADAHEPESEYSANQQNSIQQGQSATKPKSEYSPEFEVAWQAYPKRAGGNPKKSAFKAWRARLGDGVDPQAMIDGVKRYAAFVVATNKLGTEYVKQAATFFGPDMHFNESWQAPIASTNVQRGKHDGFENRDYGKTSAPAWGRQ